MSDPAQRRFVSVFPVNSRCEMLLQLRDDRPGLDGAGTWSTLGGLLEAGETAEEGARRELLEECGRRPGVLLPLGAYPLIHPRTGAREEMIAYGTAVDWTLTTLTLGEGQGMAWRAAADVPGIRLNPMIAAEMCTIAASAAINNLARAAPPWPGEQIPPLPLGVMVELGVVPGGLLLVQGISAALATRLREALPAGARLTSSPGRGEHPDVALVGDETDVSAVAVPRTWRLVPDGVTHDPLLVRGQSVALGRFGEARLVGN